MSKPIVVGMMALVLAAVSDAALSMAQEPAADEALAGVVERMAERLDAVDAARRMEGEQLVGLQRALEGTSAELLAISAKLEEIHQAVDRPLLSEFWWAFVTDNVTGALNRLFGLEASPGTPLWTAGGLALLLLVLKTLVWVAKPGTRLEKWVGKLLAVLLPLYLVILTGSLFLLAFSAPGSAIESFQDEVRASEALTTELGHTTERLASLGLRLEATRGAMAGLEERLSRAQPPGGPSAAVPDGRTEAPIVGQANELAGLKNGLDALRVELRSEIERLEGSQHGMAWTTMVGLAAAAVLGLVAVVICAWLKKWAEETAPRTR